MPDRLKNGTYLGDGSLEPLPLLAELTEETAPRRFATLKEFGVASIGPTHIHWVFDADRHPAPTARARAWFDGIWREECALISAASVAVVDRASEEKRAAENKAAADKASARAAEIRAAVDKASERTAEIKAANETSGEAGPQAEQAARTTWSRLHSRHAQKTGLLVSSDKLGPFELIHDIKCGKYLCHHCLNAVATEPDCYYNHLGYVIGNIVPACHACNRMKADTHPDTFYEIARGITAARTQGGYVPDLNVFQTAKTTLAHSRRYYRTNGATFSEEYWLTRHSMPCHYCTRPECNGIDRVVPGAKGGYNELNCVPCCKTCNMTKSDLDYISFIEQCGYIAAATLKGRPDVASYAVSDDSNLVTEAKRRRFNQAPYGRRHRIQMHTGYAAHESSLRALNKYVGENPGVLSDQEKLAIKAELRVQCRQTPLWPTSSL